MRVACGLGNAKEVYAQSGILSLGVTTAIEDNYGTICFNVPFYSR